MPESKQMLNDEDIHAYVDGELDTERDAAVAAAIAADSERATQAQAYQTQNAGLRALYDRYLEEPVPGRLLRALQEPLGGGNSANSPLASKNRWGHTLVRVAAVLVIFCLGAAAGVGGYEAFLSRPNLFQPVIKQAVLAHKMMEAEKPEPKKLVNDAGDIIDGGRLSAGFEVPLRVPSSAVVDHLRPVSFRNIAGTSGPTAQIMYEDEKGRNVSLFIRPHTATTGIPFESAQSEGYEAIYWIDGPLVYVLVGGGVDVETLARLARAVYAARGLVNETESVIEMNPGSAPIPQPATQPITQPATQNQ